MTIQPAGAEVEVPMSCVERCEDGLKCENQDRVDGFVCEIGGAAMLANTNLQLTSSQDRESKVLLVHCQNFRTMVPPIERQVTVKDD